MLMVGDSGAASAADVQQVLARGKGAAAPAPASEAGQGAHAGQGGMGEEMAVKLLAQLPEESVKKLLDLVAKQGVAA